MRCRGLGELGRRLGRLLVVLFLVLRLLGLGRGAVRKVRAEAGVVDLDAVTAVLTQVEGPVIVVGNAAEVNTGQFDDLARALKAAMKGASA